MDNLTIVFEREFESRVTGEFLEHWIGTVAELGLFATGRSIRRVRERIRRQLENAPGWNRDRAANATLRVELRRLSEDARRALEEQREAADRLREAAEAERRARAVAIQRLLLGPPGMGVRDVADLLGVTRWAVQAVATGSAERRRARTSERQEAREKRRRASDPIFGALVRSRS